MSTPSLLDMPGVVMDSIVCRLDFKAIQILRKVCRDLRSYIDNLKPDSNFREIHIKIKQETIKIYDRLSFTVVYEEKEAGCAVNAFRRKRFLENENFKEIASKDLESMLKNRKSPFHKFSLKNHTSDGSFLELILSVLKSINRLIATEDFEMYGENSDVTLEIFKCFDPNFLSDIEFTGYRDRYSIMEVEKFAETEQWKNAKWIRIYCSVSLTNFRRDFGHFENIEFYVQELSADDLVMLRDTYIASNINDISIHLREFPENQPYGEPLIDDRRETYHYWFYSIPNSEKILKIECSIYESIQFSNVERNVFMEFYPDAVLQ